MRRLRALASAPLLPLAAGCALLGLGDVAVLPGPPPSEPPPVEAGRADPPDRYGRAVDVLRYELELALPDTADFVVGGARLRLARTERLPDGLLLDFTGLHVDEALVNGEAVDWRHEEDRLTLPLPPESGDTLEVEVRYRGVPDDGLVLGPDVHGSPAAFADNWPNRARFWFPGVDHPSDKAEAAFTVHAPGHWRVVANGRLVEGPLPTPDAVPVPDPSPRRTWRWETTTPIPTYTMVVGAGDLVARTAGLAACGRAPASPRPDGCVEVTWWVFPPDTLHAARVFRRAPDMVDFFTGYVGDFPYEKLANVQSATRFGGMENASAIFYSGEAIARRADIEGTVSHEIAHQWFGDSVTPADWSHLWLSEGFASYFGALYFEGAEGPADFRARMRRYRERYLASEDVDRPIVDSTVSDLFDLLNRNNYDKGAWVLHMLRGRLGDETFRRGIREYYGRHVHGNAWTEDLRRVMEEVSGQDLESFFEQWVLQPGYPVFRTSHGNDRTRGEAVVVVAQIQDTDWPRFHTELDLELIWEGGSRRERVEVSGFRHTFTFPVPAPLLQVRIDPDGWLLHALAGESGGR